MPAPSIDGLTIAKSAALGKPKSDEVEAVARVLPKSEPRRVYNAVLRRYWCHAWWFYAHSIVRGGIDKVHVGLEIKPAVQKKHDVSGPPSSASPKRRPAQLHAGAGTAAADGFPDRDEYDGDADSDEEWDPGDSAVGVVVTELACDP